MGETQWREQKRAAARSRAHQVRAYTAHLRTRQTTPPSAQAIVLDQRLLFPQNFLIEHFRSKQGYRNFPVHVLLFRMHAPR